MSGVASGFEGDKQGLRAGERLDGVDDNHAPVPVGHLRLLFDRVTYAITPARPWHTKDENND